MLRYHREHIYIRMILSRVAAGVTAAAAAAGHVAVCDFDFASVSRRHDTPGRVVIVKEKFTILRS